MTEKPNTNATASDWDAPEGDAPAATAEPTMRVKCIVHTRPWHLEGPMVHGEEADLPASIAEQMLDNGQVRLVRIK